MCLHTHNIKPLVSGKDITVYKLVRDNGKEVTTPYQRTPCKLGETLAAEGEMPSPPPSYSCNKVASGVIHAALCRAEMMGYVEDGGEAYAVKAVIKAGTPFFVDFNLETIAARELFLTKERATYDTETQKSLWEAKKHLKGILAAQGFMAGNGGVRVGDILLSDCKTFVHVDGLSEGMKPIGIVGFIRPDGKPQVVSCCTKQKAWYCGKKRAGIPENAPRNAEEAALDFDGYGHCKEMMEYNDESIKDYKAVSWCLGFSTYGTEPGGWYLPSSGEMLQTIRNTVFINDAVSEVVCADPSTKMRPLTRYKNYWTSTRLSRTCVWGVNTLSSLSWQKSDVPFAIWNAMPFLHLP